MHRLLTLPLFAFVVLLNRATAIPGPSTREAAIPAVLLDFGTFVGSSSGSIESFLGIPFAEPPTGDRRYRLPVPIRPYIGLHTVTSYGPSCLQSSASAALPPTLPAETAQYLQNISTAVDPNGSEDCLTINVIRPAGTTRTSRLPVAAWIYGGSFATGGTRFYDGTVIVGKSIQLKEPVIYVSFNYRLNGFGFLGGKEVQDANVGNIGLHDQREAMRWVQKYISAFGGDASRVTIWGESAGAISVGIHMVANNGNAQGLFRAGFMESGSPISVGNLTQGQPFFDALVGQTGCTNSGDKLACLRAVPVNTLKTAIDAISAMAPGGSPSWLPLADGTFLTGEPQSLVSQGIIARIPFVTGDTDDEGTLFTLADVNILTDADFAAFVQNSLPGISSTDLTRIEQLYPSDVTQGSPFDTGTANAITPQYKRISAFYGDLLFQGPRRFILNNTAGKQKSWSFLSKRFKTLPIVGSAHATDLSNMYSGGDLADYLVRFVTNLDPNGNTGIAWPAYDAAAPKLLTFLDGNTPLTITDDTYREEAIEFLSEILVKTRS